MGSTGHYQDIAWRRVSRISGQTPPTFSPFTRLRAKGRHAPTGRRSDPTELEHQLKRCSTARPVRATQATSSLPAGYALPLGGVSVHLAGFPRRVAVRRGDNPIATAEAETSRRKRVPRGDRSTTASYSNPTPLSSFWRRRCRPGCSGSSNRGGKRRALWIGGGLIHPFRGLRHCS